MCGVRIERREPFASGVAVIALSASVFARRRHDDEAIYHTAMFQQIASYLAMTRANRAIIQTENNNKTTTI
jgi:hypothetical protein